MEDEVFDETPHGEKVDWSDNEIFGDSDKENDEPMDQAPEEEEEVGECVACGETDCDGSCVKSSKLSDFCPECKTNNKLRGYRTDCDTCMSA